MHIYFSGIGGAGIGPLVIITKQAGFEVSGSDMQNSQYTDYLQSQGIRLHIGQNSQITQSSTYRLGCFFIGSFNRQPQSSRTTICQSTQPKN